MKLTRWRAGKTEEVELKLRVLGTYSDTAPYDCPKSKRIFDEACKVLEKEPLEENLWGADQWPGPNGHRQARVHAPRSQFARKMAPPR